MKPTIEHLKLFREHFALSQSASAKLIGVTRVTWHRWESGKATLPPYLAFTLRGAADYLKTKEQEK